MTKYIEVYSHKGGVGVTTTACMTGIALAERGYKTLIVDTHFSEDVQAWMGTGALCTLWRMTEHSSLAPNLYGAVSGGDIPPLEKEEFTQVIAKLGYEYVVIDSSRSGSVLPADKLHAEICVTRNDYMSLRALTRSDKQHKNIVLFMLPEAALTKSDVCSVTSTTPVVFPITPAVQRSIDAGMTVPRFEANFASCANEIIDRFIKADKKEDGKKEALWN